MIVKEHEGSAEIWLDLKIERRFIAMIRDRCTWECGKRLL